LSEAARGSHPKFFNAVAGVASFSLHPSEKSVSPRIKAAEQIAVATLGKAKLLRTSNLLS
jgi:hypothetical protein